MNKTFLTFFLISIFSFEFSAQELKDDLSRLQKGEDLNVMYRNEGNFGIFAHSAGGFGLTYRRGQHVTGKRKRMFEIETQNFKHPKEVKTINDNFDNAKGIIYGKLYSVLLVRPGIGFQNVVYQKSDKKSVEIRYSYFLGGTLAFGKPVYLEIIHPSNNYEKPIISTEKYDPEKHQPLDIYGKAPFFKGIDNTKIFPGGYAKLALSFEYSDRYNGVKAIETGVVADVYAIPFQMMAFNTKQPVYVSVYLKFLWGKKWF